MVLIATALMIEATPIIEHFNLKKDISIHAYPVYRNSNIALIVSGTGKVKIAMAMTYLLTICERTYCKQNNYSNIYSTHCSSHYSNHCHSNCINTHYNIFNNNYNNNCSNNKNDYISKKSSIGNCNNEIRKHILLNVGFCGTNNTQYNLGKLLVMHKITDMDTGRDFYPDVFLDTTFCRESLCCYSKPVRREDISEDKNVFCDMESSGIMEVARKFTYAHQVLILKVVSDYLTPENLNKELLLNYICQNMLYIEQAINQIQQLNDSCSKFSCGFPTSGRLLTNEENIILKLISDNLRFTEAMQQIIVKKVKNSKIKGFEPLNILKFYIDIKVNTKIEGKKLFEQIIERLKYKPD